MGGNGGTHSPVRRRTDVDGCGCLRCQNVTLDVIRRSSPAAVAWSTDFLRRHPSTVLVLLGFGVVQLALSRVGIADRVLPDAALAAAGVGLLGVVIGRGYVGVHATAAIRASTSNEGDGDQNTSTLSSARTSLAVTLRRLPSFLVAATVVGTALFAVVIAVTRGLSQAVNTALPAVGAAWAVPYVDSALLVATVAVLIATLVKCCFLPEACFVGGYGPIAAVVATWRITTVHTRKAIGLTAGLLVLFLAGQLLDAGAGATARPAVLELTLWETTVTLRSVGLSTASPVRLALDAVVSAGYAAVFTHGYLSGALEDSP
ncbi:hypothetical protein [Halorubrum vacuolatum]|uniref:Uncharacterized protein n=1 Tax=Halorubrum vacuolatum TaxID=63740 RepID=A0A238VBH8_HALVU|nr:hypothetical protein [Halorubrum vacuolatum]SNR31762.1 hypothetical protein SAMN06264855_102222 [Halorubrum vacuolatum]